MRSSGRSKTATGFSIAAIVVLACAATSGTGWFRTVGDEDIFREVLLGAGIVCTAIAVLCIIFDGNQPEPSPQAAQHPKLYDWLFDLQTEIEKSQFARNQGAVLSFIDLMTRQANFRSRVVETIDLVGRSVRQRVNIEFVLPESAKDSEVQYLPVLFPRKGRLLNGFRLSDTGDTRITNLSYDETTRLVAVALRALIAAVTKTNFAEWSPQTHQAEFILLSIITSRGPTEDGIHRRRIAEAIRKIQESLESDAISLISSYVATLSASYPVVAVVSQDTVVANRVLVKYECAITPAAAADRVMGSIRLGLKLKPREVVVPLGLSLTAASYHLRINAPAEDYLYGQHVRCHACKQRLARKWRGVIQSDSEASERCFHEVDQDSTEDCHYHVERRRGQNYLHLYMRGYGALQKPIRNLEAMAVFKETPPGTQGAATVTALATTVFIWAAGYLISHGEVVGNSDVPALLLALPAIAASYFGFTADGDSVVGSSLLARASFVLSGVLSVIAIIEYILEIPDIGKNLTNITGRTAFAGLISTVWIVLFALSAANFIYVGWGFIRNLRFYAMLTNRPDVIDDGYLSH